MNDLYGDNLSGVAYATPTQTAEVSRQTPTQPLTTPYQAMSGQMQAQPMTPPATPKTSGGVHTGAILVLSLVLLVVLGVGVFAGWQFGRTNTSSRSANVATLQPGTGPVSTVPPLTGNNEQAVREAGLPRSAQLS